MIHPTAIIHAGAKVGPGTCIGPYAIIDDGVVLGSSCRVGPHVHLTGLTEIAEGNQFHAGCVVGDAPQDAKYKDEPTRLRIGARNVFREHVTVHRSNKLSEDTVIGSGNYFMAHSHVGHNCRIGDQNIIANGALLAGHVMVMDRAFISGNCLLHQFVRVGTLAMMQGGAAISKDLPPYTVARGDNHICGLNTVGLRRAGLTGEQRLELRKLYHLVFRSGKRMQEVLAEASQRFTSEQAVLLINFIGASHRGVCTDAGLRRGGDGEVE